MPEVKNTPEAEAVAKIVKAGFKPEIVVFEDPRDATKAPAVITPKDDGGYKVVSIKDELDRYRTNPVTKEGQATITTLQSLIDHANRFKNANSAVFVDTAKDNPSITTVIDYHAEGEGPAQFRKHKATYPFPLSAEWKAWNDANKNYMTQAHFAAFLEERALEILPPPDLSAADLSEPDQKLAEMTRLLQGRFAGPEKMMDLSSGLRVYENAEVGASVNISSGEGTVTFKEEHTDEAGVKLAIPNLFLIAIPVFEDGEAYRIAVRLRYRKKGGGLIWFYDLYRPDLSFKDAIKGAAEKVNQETSLPIFYGTPE